MSSIPPPIDRLPSDSGAFRRTASAPVADDARTSVRGAAILALSVFAACLVGIYSRPAGLLASVWPANAIMLGLLIRMPASAGARGWTAAALAYMAADLLTGTPLLRAVVLNTGNLVSVGAGYLAYTGRRRRFVNVHEPGAMLHLATAAAVAGAATGLLGALVDPFIFDSGPLRAWGFWFATEMANYIAILPMILAAPPPARRFALMRGLDSRMARFRDGLPIAALALSCVAAVLIGGPGAFAFPVPALLWCSLTYSVFSTTVLTFLFSSWTLVASEFGLLPTALPAHDEAATISARLGVSLVAIAPILLASVMASREELFDSMRRMATHDDLTGFVTRGAFRDDASSVLATNPRSVAMLMIDIDHFKTINDQYGHATGDAVLVAFARRVRSCLRAEDLCARLGGEEFAVLAASRTALDLQMLADRICAAVSGSPVHLDDGRNLTVTASIGMVIQHRASPALLNALLAAADAALYRAKARGRNCVEVVVSAAS